MSWFGSNKSKELAEKVELATSDSIPNGDIDFGAALEISDLIRSKQVPAKEAMRLLKKRFMDETNANQQKSALKLIDFCIKNGGVHFIEESASKEFMDPMVIFLKNKDKHDSVKSYLLELIQTWSILVSTNSKFDYINTIYKKLQDDGFQFPVISDFVDSTLIESKVAPEWEDSDACMMCSDLFSILNRKHHCRSCGGVFCQTHSSNNTTIPELGINIPVRVCDNCYSDQRDKKKKLKLSRKHRKSNSRDKDDDELKKAIALSLQNSNVSNNTSQRKQGITQETDDEDEDMRAAIEASLRDLKQPGVPSIAEETVQENREMGTGLYSNLMNDVSSFTHTPQQQSQYNYQNQYPTQKQCQQSQAAPAYEQPQYSQSQYQQPQYQPTVTAESQPADFYSQQYRENSQQRQIQPPYRVEPTNPTPAPLLKQDPNSLTGEDERNIVEFVDILDRLNSIPESQRVVDPSLIQLHTKIVLMHSKVNEQIVKERNELEKCQQMYAKSFAASRLYDDILAYRLKQEQQMMKTKTSYGAKFSRPAPPIPTAIPHQPKRFVHEPKQRQPQELPPKSIPPTSNVPSKPPVEKEQVTISETQSTVDQLKGSSESETNNSLSAVSSALEKEEPKVITDKKEPSSPVIKTKSADKILQDQSVKSSPSSVSDNKIPLQPTLSYNRLDELKGTVIPQKYALPPTLDLPSVPSEPLPSAPQEELVANLIDI